MKKVIFTAFAYLMCATFTATVSAEEKPTMPDEEAMKKIMALSSPGEHHTVLETLVGTWNYTMTYRMSADAPEEKTTGTSKNSWVLDGRQIKQVVNSTFDMNGQTVIYEGLGFVGYDNVKQHYTSIWMDNMNTGTMVATGTYDEASKTIKEQGHFTCPMKGKAGEFKSELRFTGEDTLTYIMHDVSDGDTPYKMMEINYTRKR